MNINTNNMRKSDVYEIGVKLFGIYLLYNLFNLIREVILTFVMLLGSNNHLDKVGGPMQLGFLIVNLISVVLLYTFFYLSVFKTRTITEIICKVDDYTENAQIILDKHAIYEIALTLIGLVIIALLLPDFVVKLECYFQRKQIGVLSNTNEMGRIISLGIKVMIGYIFIRYSRTIANFSVKNK